MEKDEKLILLVDDVSEVRKLIELSLNGRMGKGWRFISASDGYQALDILGNESPDLVILDIRMPALDGLETLRRIKDAASTRDLKVIMYTAVTDSEEQALALGASAYVCKPDLDRLLAEVEKVAG